MNLSFLPETVEPESAITEQEREACNRLGERYGLHLSRQQMAALSQRRVQSLKSAGRVEFGGGILKDLIAAFCDSPYLSQHNYEQMVGELLDMFYYFKNEAAGWLSDQELLAAMKWAFNERAHGSLELLANTSLEELCRGLRGGMWWASGDWEEDGDEQ